VDGSHLLRKTFPKFIFFGVMIAELVLSVVELKGHGLRPCRKSLRTIDGAAISAPFQSSVPSRNLPAFGFMSAEIVRLILGEE
jgi:hypothetical protein